MSMLAQGRQKQKISTNPNGLLFSADESNIGQRLMNQMGWEKGKGLGANEQGDKDPIKVKVNFESRGLGCSKADADKWIAHQDDFNSLLANLNQNVDSEEETSDEPTNKQTVQSLEAKSKSSRSRVHYQKFTRGKDLSRRSDKDLACILGPSRSGNSTPLPQSKNTSTANSDNESNSGSADPFLSDAIHVTSTLSLQEYFASKMAAKKNSSSNTLDDLTASTPSPDADTAEDIADDVVKPSFFIGDTVDEDEESTKKKKKKKKHRRLEMEPAEEIADVSHLKRKKKKRKKERRDEEHSTSGKTKPKPADDSMRFVSESSEDESREVVIPKISKKKREHVSDDEVGSENLPMTKKAKTMKKSKSDSLLSREDNSGHSKNCSKKKHRDDS